ncbi:MAG TPA: nuclear transport factor 2 family protein [Archangium sp.]|uniref:nuclear transport factor 2 family protein n=1 Tax=Archangium sp. TaxID=1872627 RepID=UPI002E2F6125|nr:nuclear transport factor 2 family protein [Archangium sp.]HEX5749974.1 nuclear transport factor 2 family protein [Archangium sp.]
MSTLRVSIFAAVLTLAMSGCMASTQEVPESEQARQTAQRAYEAFAQGWATGDFEPYLAMLTQDFEFSFPTGEDRGRYTGAEGYQRMVNKVRGHSTRGERLTLLQPLRVMSDGKTIVFEFESRGQFGDHAYRGHNIIGFDVTGDRISAFREFFGDVEPALLCGAR